MYVPNVGLVIYVEGCTARSFILAGAPVGCCPPWLVVPAGDFRCPRLGSRGGPQAYMGLDGSWVGRMP